MVRVIKKDHTKEAFNIQKVVIAVNKSANRVLYTFTEDELKAICGHVEGYIRDHGMTEVQIWQMHNIVEAALEAVRPEECDTVSIAGMGGQTIADILAAAPWTGDGEHLLLLQPMTMVYELRQWLWAHGYMIECETVCREERRYYVVLSVRGGGPVRVVPLSSCAFSPALLQAAVARTLTGGGRHGE